VLEEDEGLSSRQKIYGTRKSIDALTIRKETITLEQEGKRTRVMDEKVQERILRFQKSEITEHLIYRGLANRTKGKNAEVLNRISEDELHHYNQWKKFTAKDVPHNKLTVLGYLTIARIFGLTFTMKMMEGGEEKAKKAYSALASAVPGADTILKDEVEHERLLVGMIDEERIGYISSVVVGLNDALVELTGALAGLTFTFQNARLIGVAGLITGIAASLSMSASEYLSQKSEKTSKSPIKASFYTGTAYILTVLLLVAPFFLLADYYMALGVTVLDAVFVVLFFSFFVSVVKELSFRRMFLEMLFVGLGVAAVSFILGWLVHGFLGVEI